MNGGLVFFYFLYNHVLITKNHHRLGMDNLERGIPLK